MITSDCLFDKLVSVITYSTFVLVLNEVEQDIRSISTTVTHITTKIAKNKRNNILQKLKLHSLQIYRLEDRNSFGLGLRRSAHLHTETTASNPQI